MADAHVITALRAKRAQLSGEIRDLEKQMHDLRRDMQHVDATLRLFAPGDEPQLIKPIRPYRPRNRLFEPKELTLRVMTALREAEGEPMTVGAIGDRIMAEKGIKEPAGKMIRGIVAVALRGLCARGVVVATDEEPKRWAVKP